MTEGLADLFGRDVGLARFHQVEVSFAAIYGHEAISSCSRRQKNSIWTAAIHICRVGGISEWFS